MVQMITDDAGHSGSDSGSGNGHAAGVAGPAADAGTGTDETGPSFERAADGLTLHVPPPPAGRRMLVPAAVLAGATLLLLGPLAAAAALPSDPSGWPVVLLLVLAAAGGWLLALRHFRRLARLARLPSAVRAAGDGALSVALPTATAEQRLHWPAGQVRDLRVAATGALPVVREFLWLRVTPRDGPVAMIQIPWAMPRPGAGLLDEIQGTLREAVGLPRKPDDRR